MRFGLGKIFLVNGNSIVVVAVEFGFCIGVQQLLFKAGWIFCPRKHGFKIRNSKPCMLAAGIDCVHIDNGFENGWLLIV